MSHSILLTWVASLVNKRVVILTNKDIVTKPFLHGEDYYIHTIASKAITQGISVRIQLLQATGLCVHSRKPLKNLENTVDRRTVMILHNVSPFHIVGLKIRRKPVIVMPVYFIWSKVSKFANFKEALGAFLWQLMVDEYLVTSPKLAQSLRKIGVVKKINVVPLEYICAFCNPIDNLKKKLSFETFRPNVVQIVYIGSMIPNRFPLIKIIDVLNRNKEMKYNLRIYTMSDVGNREYTAGNVQVKVTQAMLSEKEKCNILQESHIFIAPAEGTTMDPSLSVIEAEYHGNVIARFYQGQMKIAGFSALTET